MGEISASEDASWFVLSVAFGRELLYKRLLQERCGIRCFVPERRVRMRNASGRFFYKRIVAVPNYIFALASKDRLDMLKADASRRFLDLNFVRNKAADGRFVPAIVPACEMENFIAVAGNEEEHVLFLDPKEIDWCRGQRVRILGGPFEGVEGTFLRVSKKHERRVVVQVAGISAVATTALPAVLVRKIDDSQ